MPAVPTYPTIVGGVLTTSQLAQLAAVEQFLQTPPLARLRQTAAQTFTTGVSAAITFTAEDVDTDVDAVGGHDNAVNTSRYTARYPGWYQVSAAVTYAVNATGTRHVNYQVNGASVNGADACVPAQATLSARCVGRTIHVYLNAGDYVETTGFQNSGGNLNSGVSAVEQSTLDVRWVST